MGTFNVRFLKSPSPSQVDAGEFVSAMAQLLEGLTPASLDDRINTMLHKEVGGSGLERGCVRCYCHTYTV